MSRTRRRMSTLGAMAATVAVLAACGGGESPAGNDSDGQASGEYGLVGGEGVLTVCTNAPYVPFEFEDSSAPSGYSGFDIDLTQAIADELDLTLSVQNVSFEALQAGTVFAAGQCDLGASAITITEERSANLTFSDPYYDSLQSLLVASDSGISSIDDLDGARVGVQAGTTGRSYAEQNAPESAELVDYPSDGELWPALQAGQIDAILQDQPVNVSHVQQTDGYELVGEYPTDEQYGFAMALDAEPALVDAINGALSTLRESGSYTTIYDTYFAADSTPVADDE